MVGDATALIVKVSVTVAVSPYESVILKVTGKSPVAVGVPLTRPVDPSRLKPPGSDPDAVVVSKFVMAPTPPVEVTLWL